METTATDKKKWTILSLLNWSGGYLEEKGFESPRLNVELLLCDVLSCDRMDLYTNFDKPLAADELSRFKSKFKRRLTYEPIQYILGECEFMGLQFFVDKRVLIPRPETEILVEQVIQLSQSISLKNILDIGAGSGNIPVSLAKHIEGVQVDSIDASSEALEVAQSNIERHNVEDRVRLILCDILDSGNMLQGKQYDVIVSNPPYISETEFELLQPEVKDYEPKIATTDQGDGLTFYKAIVNAGKSSLRRGGSILVEVAYNQSGDVLKMFQSAGYNEVGTVRDYSGIERVVKARWD
jgi:release factor glutamine methyltransferase